MNANKVQPHPSCAELTKSPQWMVSIPPNPLKYSAIDLLVAATFYAKWRQEHFKLKSHPLQTTPSQTCAESYIAFEVVTPGPNKERQMAVYNRGISTLTIPLPSGHRN